MWDRWDISKGKFPHVWRYHPHLAEMGATIVEVQQCSSTLGVMFLLLLQYALIGRHHIRTTLSHQLHATTRVSFNGELRSLIFPSETVFTESVVDACKREVKKALGLSTDLKEKDGKSIIGTLIDGSTLYLVEDSDGEEDSDNEEIDNYTFKDVFDNKVDLPADISVESYIKLKESLPPGPHYIFGTDSDALKSKKLYGIIRRMNTLTPEMREILQAKLGDISIDSMLSTITKIYEENGNNEKFTEEEEERDHYFSF
jgi:hypothetical protein